MSEYDNTNTGAIFVNDKGGNDKRPDRKGTLNVEGVDYWISGWLRTSKSGDPFLSLKVERKDKQQNQARPAPQARPEAVKFDDDDDSSIPF